METDTYKAQDTTESYLINKQLRVGWAVAVANLMTLVKEL